MDVGEPHCAKLPGSGLRFDVTFSLIRREREQWVASARQCDGSCDITHRSGLFSNWGHPCWKCAILRRRIRVCSVEIGWGFCESLGDDFMCVAHLFVHLWQWSRTWMEEGPEHMPRNCCRKLQMGLTLPTLEIVMLYYQRQHESCTSCRVQPVGSCFQVMFSSTGPTCLNQIIIEWNDFFQRQVCLVVRTFTHERPKGRTFPNWTMILTCVSL